MKILQIRGEFSDNGPATQMLTIAKNLLVRGYVVEVAASGGLLKETIINEGIHFNLIPELARTSRSPWKVILAILKLRKVFVEREIDVVHAHNAATLYISYFASLFLSRKINLFHSCHGIELRKGYQWRNWIYLNYPGRVFAVSQFTKNELLRIGVPEEKIIVTYNGIDLNRFDISKKAMFRSEIRKEFGIPDDAVVVGIIGRMGFKGHDEIIKAFARMQDEYLNFYALLVGGGPKFDKFKQLAVDLGTNERLLFANVRFDAEKFNSAFDIFALPSYWGEMFPCSILEAMSMATPIISTDLSGIPEILQNGEGFIIKIKDTEALEGRLRELLDDKGLRVSMGEQARKTLLEKFTIETVVDKIEAAYLS